MKAPSSKLLVWRLRNSYTFVALKLAWGEARRRKCIPSDTPPTEQRSLRPISAQPGGRPVFRAELLLAPHRSTSGYARRSRLASAQNPLPRMYSYFGDTTLALDHVDFDRLDLNSHPFEPFNGGLDVGALTFQLKTNDSDFIGYAGLAHVCNDFELVAQFPNHGRGDQFRRVHQPEARFLWLVVERRSGRRLFFSCAGRHEVTRVADRNQPRAIAGMVLASSPS